VRLKHGQIFSGQCAACEAYFIRRAKCRDIGKFCARQCYFDLKYANAEMAARAAMEHAEREQRCRVCDAPTPGRRGGLCGDECRKAAARQQYRETYAHKTQVGVCPQCHEPWKVIGLQGRSKKFCSRACCLTANRRSGSPERRARRAGVPYQKVIPRRVLARDKWTCHICGCKTPERLRGTLKSTAPEVDHVVPLAMGGAHTYDNVRCACRSCNQAKGARWVGQRGLEFEIPRNAV
jgi:5-methylcytosine-specific restriction endonuclease McrA